MVLAVETGYAGVKRLLRPLMMRLRMLDCCVASWLSEVCCGGCVELVVDGGVREAHPVLPHVKLCVVGTYKQ